jgi:DNA-binding IclR family transcriptional regulator
MLRRDEGRWALGPTLARLGSAAGPLLVAASRPALEELRAATRESVQLFVRRGSQRVCVASLESPHSLRTIVPVGAVLPLGLGSAGRVLQGATRPWVQTVEEREAGVASVSAPVRDGMGAVLAAVSVSGPVERTTRRPGARYGALVVAAASAVERAAGLAVGDH